MVEGQQHGHHGQHQGQHISRKSDRSAARSSVQAPLLNPQLRDAVLSVVQKERLSSQRRSKNVVIKGLKVSTSGNDTVLASDIIYEQLEVCVDIVNTRRLGQPGNGAVQSLLVMSRNSKDADLVLSHAKDLRNTSDEYVRIKVYISADLTSAEAKAAYEQRYNVNGKPADQQYSSQPGDHQHDHPIDRLHGQQERNQLGDQSHGCTRDRT